VGTEWGRKSSPLNAGVVHKTVVFSCRRGELQSIRSQYERKATVLCTMYGRKSCRLLSLCSMVHKTVVFLS
jgi:hypothetical protein